MSFRFPWHLPRLLAHTECGSCCLIWCCLLMRLVLLCIQDVFLFFFFFLVPHAGSLAGTTYPFVCFVFLLELRAYSFAKYHRAMTLGILKKSELLGCSVYTDTWPPLWEPECGVCHCTVKSMPLGSCERSWSLGRWGSVRSGQVHPESGLWNCVCSLKMITLLGREGGFYLRKAAS